MSLYINAMAAAIFVFGVVMCAVPVLVWMERKGAAYIQDRRGPNRASIFGIRMGGLVHSLADALKLLTKTEFIGDRFVKSLFIIAPVVALSVPILAAAIVPLAEPVEIFGINVAFQVADLSGGLLYALAISALGVYALLIGGWASINKYSFLGAIRASAQMISYELAMGLSAAAIFLVAGSFRLSDIISDQGIYPWMWNFIRQPAAFIIFFCAMFAECNRLPFDLPEGESELVAGYHTEYSSMRFAMFYMGEYAHIIVGSLIMAAVFFGGWQIPFASGDLMRSDIVKTGSIGGGIAGLVSVALGIIMVRRFKRRYRDARDFEVLVFGAPLCVAGIALIGASIYLVMGPWTISYDASKIIVAAIQLIAMLAKTVLIAGVFIWARWTLPRFRYDQLMRLGWKGLLPLGLLNLIVTAGILIM